MAFTALSASLIDTRPLFTSSTVVQRYTQQRTPVSRVCDSPLKGSDVFLGCSAKPMQQGFHGVALSTGSPCKQVTTPLSAVHVASAQDLLSQTRQPRATYTTPAGTMTPPQRALGMDIESAATLKGQQPTAHQFAATSTMAQIQPLHPRQPILKQFRPADLSSLSERDVPIAGQSAKRQKLQATAPKPASASITTQKQALPLPMRVRQAATQCPIMSSVTKPSQMSHLQRTSGTRDAQEIMNGKLQSTTPRTVSTAGRSSSQVKYFAMPSQAKHAVDCAQNVTQRCSSAARQPKAIMVNPYNRC